MGVCSYMEKMEMSIAVRKQKVAVHEKKWLPLKSRLLPWEFPEEALDGVILFDAEQHEREVLDKLP